MTLPMPGPGRPQHPSYSQPGQQASLVELLALVFGGGVVYVLFAFVEAVS